MKRLWRRLRALWRVAASALARYDAEDGAAMAGYVAYSTFLAVFPFAIFATALLGALVTDQMREEWMAALFELAPEHVALTLEPVIDNVTRDRGGALITVSAAGALWAASNAIESIRVAFDRAYGIGDARGFLARRALALAFVLLAVATFALLAVLVIAAPLALALVETHLGVATPYGLGLVRYAVGLAVFAGFLALLHLALPSRPPSSRRIAPGIVVTVALWAAGAWAFSVYLSLAPSFSLTYGAFAGVIVTLLFFYLTGAAIILGAAVNATLLAFRHARLAETTAS